LLLFNTFKNVTHGLVDKMTTMVLHLSYLILMFWNRHEVHRVQAHTVCTTQVDKNRHNRRFYNGVGGRTAGLQTLS